MPCLGEAIRGSGEGQRLPPEAGLWGGRGRAIPRRSFFYSHVATSAILPPCTNRAQGQLPGHPALVWSSVLAGCGGCTSALLPSPSPCMDSLGRNKPTLQQEEWRSDREKHCPVYEEGSAVWEQKLVHQPFPPVVSMAPSPRR